MAENKYFMDGVDLTEETFNAYMQKVMANDGYLVGEGSELEVIENTPAAMNVVVGTGMAWIRGVQYENTAAKTVTVDAADATNPRIDRIVVRLTWAADTVEAVYLKGTAAASPSAPALTQSAAVWELSLAQILVTVGKTSIVTGDITDERDAAACGQAACRLGDMHIDADGSLDAASKQIHNLLDPTGTQDAAPKGYVDAAGFEIGDTKWSCRISPTTGWFLCDASEKSRSTYAALFNAITIQQTGTLTSGSAVVTGLSDTSNMKAGMPISGTGIPADTTIQSVYSSTQITLDKKATATGAQALVVAPFGVGDGSTTFNLPAGGEVPVGYLSGDADFGTLGKTGGEKTHTLSAAEMPTHTHTGAIAAGTGFDNGYGAGVGTGASGPAGSGNAHNNLQPYQVLNMFIKYA